MPKRKTIRRILPWERLPQHFAAEVGGDKEVAVIETQGGDFKIQTREHEYELDPPPEEPEVHIEAENVFVIKKAQIRPDDIKRLSNLEDAGIRGGIHSKRTYLMALKDGSLWIWKQTGAEERDEIFVYELAKRMFRAIVPEVQPVFVPKMGWGSAMRKVAGVPAGRTDGLHGYFHGNDEMMADLAAMLVLDYMTGNSDRHSNNWFLMHNDRLAAIDNGWAGEDLAMSFADVFQPARLAGMMEDERLWPQLLRGIAALIQELSGKGDEVRALAEEIGIDKKEAVDMVRLWEPKLASMAKLIRSEAGRVEKARTYVESPADAPEGTQTQRGPRGGIYYETEGDEERESGVFYHGTNQQAAALMEQQGFGTAERIGGMAPAAAPEERGLTFLTPSKRAAHWFAHENFRAPEFGGPSVIKVGFDGRVLRITKAKSIYEAARALGVKHHPQRGFDFEDFRRKMTEAGYDAVAFSDKNAGGREALAVFNTESLRFGGKAKT